MIDMDEALNIFVRQHRNDDIRQLALQASRYPDVDVRRVLVQISGWQTAVHKLPLWAERDGIWFPEHLSMEQCSSQTTASYKAEVAASLLLSPTPSSSPDATFFPPSGSSSPKSLQVTDLTGGFGVDATLLALRLQARLCLVERNAYLCNIVRHNLPLLGVNDFAVVNADAEQVLQQLSHQHLIFIDPARRDAHGGKTVAIADCTPNLLQLNDLLLERAEVVMAKLSPMLDLSQAVHQLRAIRSIHIVSVGNECKEVLLVLSASATGEPDVVCVNVQGGQRSVFSARRSDEQAAVCSYAPAVRSYLYEPNASLMKAALFKSLAQAFRLEKLHPNSHLYTSDELHADFPGRVFAVRSVATFNKRELRQLLSGMTQANIAVRNFPLSVSDLRKRLKISEGGSNYLFATTLADDTHVLVVTMKA